MGTNSCLEACKKETFHTGSPWNRRTNVNEGSWDRDTVSEQNGAKAGRTGRKGRGKKTLQPSFPILQLRTKLNSRSPSTQQSTPHNGQSLFYFLSYILGIHIYIYVFRIYIYFCDGRWRSWTSHSTLLKCPERKFFVAYPTLSLEPFRSAIIF